MYLRHHRHILIQAYYVRTTKIMVILVPVIFQHGNIQLCLKRSLPMIFKGRATWTLANIILQMPLLRTVPLAVTWHFITILNNATKAFSRFMCIFSYADFAVLFNNLASLDTSYWIMFFELKIYIILWVKHLQKVILLILFFTWPFFFFLVFFGLFYYWSGVRSLRVKHLWTTFICLGLFTLIYLFWLNWDICYL